MAALVSYADALALAGRAARPLTRVQELPLARAEGAVLAHDVVAPFDVPSFTRAAMDGYAVQAADVAEAATERPARLRCVGEVLAGHVPSRSLRRGDCYAIATGAPLPDGADTVVRIEDTARENDTVLIRVTAHLGQNIGAIGEDIRCGDTVVARETLLTPARLGACASVGAQTVAVFEPPRTALLATGDEIVEPGKFLGPGQIYETNTLSVAALLDRHRSGDAGAIPVLRLPDRAEPIRAALRDLAELDLVVSTAGTSVGKMDLVPALVREQGDIVFHGVAVKPGRPILLARLRAGSGENGGALFLGLPGFPASCLMMAYLFLVPMARAMAHLPPWEPTVRRARLTRTVAASPELHTFSTVRLEGDRAEPAFKVSSVITSLSGADGWIEIPPGHKPLAENDPVDVRLF